VPREPNDVWTADFKGWFRTRDGTRVRACSTAAADGMVLLTRSPLEQWLAARP
jgi:hypothetical protein